MNREEFLSRVRAAAQVGRSHPVHVRHDLNERVGYDDGGPDLAARLAAEVTQAGGVAELVDDLPAAGAAIAAIARRHGATSALVWQHPLLERLGLDALLSELRIDRWHYERLRELDEAPQRAAMLAADLGITSASCAIAETGTLAMIAGPGRERVASLLPPVHVAVVGASQIVPDLFDLFDRLADNDPQSIASNLTLITGPSKTGDLELKLTTGVHGPRVWYVVIVRDEGGA